MKRCSRCDEEKPPEEFYNHRINKDGLYSHCIECCGRDNDKDYAIRGKNPDRILRERQYHLKRRYGLSLEQYDELFNQQEGCCAICLKHQSDLGQRLAVDHDHVTNEIRGLACTFCNHRVIGRHRDADMIRRLAAYLEQGTGLFVPEKIKPKKRRRTARKAKNVETKHPGSKGPLA